MYILSNAEPDYLFQGISSTAIFLVTARVIAGQYNTLNVVYIR